MMQKVCTGADYGSPSLELSRQVPFTENCSADGHFGWYEGCGGWAVYIPELEMWHLRCLDD